MATRSKKGSVTKRIFLHSILPWFAKQVDKHRAPDEYVAMLLDGALMHGLKDLEVLDFCRTHGNPT